MPALTVNAKGELTLRYDVLHHLHVEPGDEVAIDSGLDGRIMLSVVRKQKGIEALFGVLKREGQPVLTIEQINETIERGWAGER